ncbi:MULTISPECIES: hypothetical protein [unclassified Nonomuraea]|uniref:hypothetical protein n=1 Tax=unclassified Nonomuraea TaxID=2593643 RepID=UPI0033CECC90
MAVLALGGIALTPAATAFAVSAMRVPSHARPVQGVKAEEWQQLPGLASRSAVDRDGLGP